MRPNKLLVLLHLVAFLLTAPTSGNCQSYEATVYPTRVRAARGAVCEKPEPFTMQFLLLNKRKQLSFQDKRRTFGRSQRVTYTVRRVDGPVNQSTGRQLTAIFTRTRAIVTEQAYGLKAGGSFSKRMNLNSLANCSFTFSGKISLSRNA